MLYKINCSYGEVVDKIIILEIKLAECKNELQKQNILNEYNTLAIYIKDKQNDTTFKDLYNELHKINKQLWLLEDTIREKSRKKEFDKAYIECAENIHINNDKRYNIKRQINITYNSMIIEEKIYKTDIHEEKITDILHFNDDEIVSKEDRNTLHKCSSCFETGEFVKTKNMLKILCDKYQTSSICVSIIKIFFSHNTIMEVFNETNEYSYKLKTFVEIVNNNKNKLENSFVEEVNKMYGLFLLRQKKYKESQHYIKYLQVVTSPQYNISPDTMGFFKEDDKNKTLLIYFSGGIGDIIMHARFIKQVCEIQQEKQNNNTVLFLIEDKLYWIYNYIYTTVYSHINNIQIIPFCLKNNLPHFDYHVNINMLFSYLNLHYSNIYIDYYLEFLPNSNLTLKTYLNKNKSNVIINWCGNKLCSHEKHNRSIYLNKLSNLFKKTNSFINWICVQKNVSQEEKSILNKYNVKYIGDQIDNDADCYKDTITILKQVDLVISTDTSLVHIAGTANILCWCLLVKGCDWRWTNDETTKWYPNIKLIRQTNVSNWTDVIDKVIENLEKKFH
jgi:hypothetical protein